MEGRTTVKVVDDSEWSAMFKKLEQMADDELLSIWAALRRYDPTQYYAPGITMDSWAQAVYSQLDQRGLPKQIKAF